MLGISSVSCFITWPFPSCPLVPTISRLSRLGVARNVSDLCSPIQRQLYPSSTPHQHHASSSPSWLPLSFITFYHISSPSQNDFWKKTFFKRIVGRNYLGGWHDVYNIMQYGINMLSGWCWTSERLASWHTAGTVLRSTSTVRRKRSFQGSIPAIGHRLFVLQWDAMGIDRHPCAMFAMFDPRSLLPEWCCFQNIKEHQIAMLCSQMDSFWTPGGVCHLVAREKLHRLRISIVDSGARPVQSNSYVFKDF